MPNWLTISLALIFFFVSTFLVTWAIREGGSFAFMARWFQRPGVKPPEKNDLQEP